MRWITGLSLAGKSSIQSGDEVGAPAAFTAGVVMGLITMTMPDGKIEQYIVLLAG